MSEGFDAYDVPARDIEDADDDARPIKGFPNPDITESPVLPLGYSGRNLVFAMPEGEIRIEPAAKIGPMLRTDLFACAAGQTFLTYWRGEEDKFLQALCAIWFVRKCRDAGKWDIGRPRRSLGLWPDNGAVVLHMGDELFRLKSDTAKGELVSIIEALRERKSGPLYENHPPAPRPAARATVADGQWLRETLDLWHFQEIGSEGLTGADVIAGHLMVGLLGAVAPFRPHALASAAAGAGKTTLVRFVHAAQSAIAGDIIDSFTEAGLRGDLSGKARPALLDETEASPAANGQGPVERVLETLRRMSTGNGGSRRQGGLDGGTVTQTAVGCVLMAAINPPKLSTADASRFVEVRLQPLADLPEGRTRATRAELEAAIEKARALAPALLGRAMKGAWRYREDVEAVTAALARAGETPRTADLVAALAAGRRLLLADAPLTDAEADAEVALWRPLLAERATLEVQRNDGADALAHLMAADPGVQRHGRRETLGGILERWVKLGDDEYADVLAAHGLRVQTEPGPGSRAGPWLLVANHHTRLERIFATTPWGDWSRTLGRLNELGPEFKVWRGDNSIRFGIGSKQRYVAIPLTPWFENRAARMAPGVTPLPRSSAVPPSVPEEDDDWPE